MTNIKRKSTKLFNKNNFKKVINKKYFSNNFKIMAKDLQSIYDLSNDNSEIKYRKAIKKVTNYKKIFKNQYGGSVKIDTSYIQVREIDELEIDKIYFMKENKDDEDGYKIQITKIDKNQDKIQIKFLENFKIGDKIFEKDKTKYINKEIFNNTYIKNNCVFKEATETTDTPVLATLNSRNSRNSNSIRYNSKSS